jgi:DNA-binding transcriptional MerR regulator
VSTTHPAPSPSRYGIGDLADLGGVSRRTVRYYVREGLLPAPFGVGRGDHYGPEHLDQLLRVKSLQAAGHSLDEIRRALGRTDGPPRDERLPGVASAAVQRTLWRRLALAPGVELHVAGDVRLPAPGTLDELAAWCRQHFHPHPTTENPDA